MSIALEKEAKSIGLMDLALNVIPDFDIISFSEGAMNINEITTKRFAFSQAEIVELIDNIILGVKEGHTREEIISQIDLLVDKESQEAIKEAREEYAAGKLSTYSLDELIRDLSSST